MTKQKGERTMRNRPIYADPMKKLEIWACEVRRAQENKQDEAIPSMTHDLVLRMIDVIKELREDIDTLNERLQATPEQAEDIQGMLDFIKKCGKRECKQALNWVDVKTRFYSPAQAGEMGYGYHDQ